MSSGDYHHNGGGGPDWRGNGWGRDDMRRQRGDGGRGRGRGRGGRGRGHHINRNRMHHRNNYGHSYQGGRDNFDDRRDNGGDRFPNNDRGGDRAAHHEGRGQQNNDGGQTQPDPKRLKSAAQPAEAAAATDEPSNPRPLALDTMEGRMDHFLACVGEQWQQDIKSVPKQAWRWRPGRNELPQREAAAERVLKKLRSMTRPPTPGRGGTSRVYDCDSSSSESADGKVLDSEHVKFIMSLPSCTPADTGFPVVPYRKGDDGFCYCPLGRSMQPWRAMCGISTDCFDECDKTSFRPNDFMDHLKKKGGEGEIIDDIAHHALWRYLTFLYEDWFGEGFGHKALHKELDVNWWRADYEERRILALQLERKQIEAEELKSKLEQKEQENERFQKLSKDQQERIERLESEREALKIEKKVETVLTDKQLLGYKQMITHHFAVVKDLAGFKTHLKISVKTKSQDIGGGENSVGFSLQEFFDALFDSDSNTNARIALFGNEDANKIAKLIISTWEVTYEKLEAYDNTKKAKAQKKRDTGKDEGGPSRQFLTDLFKQLDSLCIKSGQKKVKLFKKTVGGVMPVEDETLERRVEREAKSRQEQTDLIQRAKAYFRAIGRIMLHSFANGHILPLSILPNFFMKVLLHGYNEDYHREDILKHVQHTLIVDSTKTLSWLMTDESQSDFKGNQWTTDSIFSEYIPEQFIRSRKTLLGGLAEGMSIVKTRPSGLDVEQGCSLAGMLKIVPFEAIQKIWFSKPTIEIDDVLRILAPRYNVLDDDKEWKGSEGARAQRHMEQERFYEGNFKRYLRVNAEKDNLFLQRFVECTTGYNYLPYDVSKDEGEVKDFSITIEFDNNRPPLGYPSFHTCTFEVVFPGSPIFFENYESFCGKMDDAITQAYNQFNMI